MRKNESASPYTIIELNMGDKYHISSNSEI